MGSNCAIFFSPSADYLPLVPARRAGPSPGRAYSSMYTTKQFLVRAWSDPATVSRVVNPFVQLGLIPRRIEAQVLETMMEVTITQDGLGMPEAERLADKLGGIFLVQDVSLHDVVERELDPAT